MRATTTTIAPTVIPPMSNRFGFPLLLSAGGGVGGIGVGIGLGVGVGVGIGVVGVPEASDKISVGACTCAFLLRKNTAAESIGGKYDRRAFAFQHMTTRKLSGILVVSYVLKGHAILAEVRIEGERIRGSVAFGEGNLNLIHGAI